MGMMGDDGLGFELARKLESHGVWRSWLGDPLYSSFVHVLSSAAAWEAFMRADDSKTKSQIQLQLRARALLFDKASVSLFSPFQLSSAVSKLNPSYLELHEDDVYFTLENGTHNGDQLRQGLYASNVAPIKVEPKSSICSGSRFSDSEVDAVPQRVKFEELPDTWYTQYFEKYRVSKSYRMLGDRESEKRTPEQMSTYLRMLESHKRRRSAFNDNALNLRPNVVIGDYDAVDETPFFPETMFTLNCVPDCAVLEGIGLDDNQKGPCNGVLDNLPQIMTKSPVISPIMIERLGIRPEYLNMEQGGHQTCGKHGSQGSRRLLGQQVASQMSEKVVQKTSWSTGSITNVRESGGTFTKQSRV